MSKSFRSIVERIEDALERPLDDFERGELARLIGKFKCSPHQEAFELKCDEEILSEELLVDY